MSKQKFLFHSSPKPGLEYLEPTRLSPKEGFKKGEWGVWATDDLVTSRAFGIDTERYGHFYLEPHSKILELINWTIKRIPNGTVAYTYFLNPADFKKNRDWKYIAHKKVKPLGVRPYPVKYYLLRHFTIWELKKVSEKRGHRTVQGL
jgi:hypothetical protein